MANTELIQKKLPQDLWAKAQEFIIPDKFLDEMPELIILVLNSKSMDTKEEKQSWFNLLPLMNKEQIDKLLDILTREKQKLDEIEKKYDQKKDDLKTKYSQKWEDMGYAKKMDEIRQKENVNNQKEQEQADNLLTQI